MNIHQKKLLIRTSSKFIKASPSKDTVRKMKRQAKDCKNDFPNHKSDKKLVFKIYKELFQLNIKNINYLKWAKV